MSGQRYDQGMPYGMPRETQPPQGGRRGNPDGHRQDGNQSQEERQRGPQMGRQNLPAQHRLHPSGLRKGPPNNQKMRGQRFPVAPGGQGNQWPLPNDHSGQHRGPPPQRPPRPNFVPPTHDSPRRASSRDPPGMTAIPQYPPRQSPSREEQLDFPKPGVWSDDGYMSYPSPNASRPVTGSSVASSSSSYSNPEAIPPVPQLPPSLYSQQQQQQQLQQRARAPLGPPPSARRGPPSYYPQAQTAHVMPIEEESDSQRGSIKGFRPDSKGSYASSNAIPIGVPDYYLNDAGRSYNERGEHIPKDDDIPLDPPPPIGGTSSSGSDSGREGSPGPVPMRQASLGKRSKPTLTTIKSGENLKTGPQRGVSDETPPVPSRSRMAEPASMAGVVGGVAALNHHNKENSKPPKGHAPAYDGNTRGFGEAEKPYDDRTSSDSERSEAQGQMPTKGYREPLPANARVARNPPAKSADPRVESILNRLEKGGAISPTPNEKPKQSSKLADRVGPRRPPRINVEAVREAEARGSITSLPDLIRRATTLASNLDRGRTASRLGLGWMDDEKRHSSNSNKHRRSGISDMLSAFPRTPGDDTPKSRDGKFGWPSNLRHSHLPSESDAGEASRKKKKRACGMPLWLFLLMILLLLLLIAAAVVVPVFLIVLPRQHKHAPSLDSCRQQLDCQNGGTNVLGTAGKCQCLCVNGFTGSTCTTQSGPGCGSTSVPGANNATIGDTIPRLLSGAQSNYSVALNDQTILGLFSATNLSCSAENALVDFKSLSTRSVSLLSDRDELEADIPTQTIERRQGTSTESSDSAQTSNGIVFAAGSPTSSPGTSPSSSVPAIANSTSAQDFARVAVLYVLQDSGQLNDALMAQQALQTYFTSGQDSGGQSVQASNVTLQNGYSINLVSSYLRIGNGTWVGKKP